MPFSVEQLQQIHFLATPMDPNRIVPCLSFFVNGEWHCWMAFGEKLEKMQMWPVEASYFGDKPERLTDQRFPILHLIAQHTLFADVLLQFRGIWNDYQSLAASLAKLTLYYRSRNDGIEVSRFVQTELEYIILVCRSLFDLLQ